MGKQKIKLIIFDYDGTIVKRNMDKIIEETFSDLENKDEVVRFVRKNYPEIKDLLETLKATLNAFSIPITNEIIMKYRNRYVHSFYTNGTLNPGVKELINSLRDSYKLVILSNGSKNAKIEELKNNNLLEYFDEIITQEDSGYAKPDSRAFEYILKKYKIKPEEAISIGNSSSFDMVPAKKLGINTILIVDLKADVIVKNIEDVNKEIISKL